MTFGKERDIPSSLFFKLHNAVGRRSRGSLAVKMFSPLCNQPYLTRMVTNTLISNDLMFPVTFRILICVTLGHVLNRSPLHKRLIIFTAKEPRDLLPAALCNLKKRLEGMAGAS